MGGVGREETVGVAVTGHPRNEEEVEDLTKLEDVTLNNVLDCLIERFNHQKYCTFAGSVLVSLNPCSKDVTKQNCVLSSTTTTTQNEEVKRFVNLSTQIGEAGLKRMKPHVLSLGVKSLYNIKRVQNNQVIVVSGDSGAGKTTCTQDLIKFFTHSHGQNEQEAIFTLERKIYEATLILEALGNASTIANPNSSRFGRLVQLQYNSDCKIIGAQIKTYLLEKHRVAKGNSNERNFHIFHFLLQAVNNGYFKAVANNKQVFEASFWKEKVDNDSDWTKFINLLTALTILGLVDDFLEYFHVLFAILNLLSIKFVEEWCTEENKENLSGQFRTRFMVSEETQPHLAEASVILGLEESQLHHSLIFHTFAAGNRQSISLSPCVRKEDCESKLHALISSLYDTLFHHTVKVLNNLLRHDDGSTTPKASANPNEVELTDNKTCTVSILDLYGFENLEFNGFEQLCINYANERIQQVQISVLKGYFAEEQFALNFAEPQELNRVETEIIERLDELHNRVFCILNEACLLKRPTPDKVVFERLSLESKSKSDKFITVGNLHDKSCPFVIKHYASDVNYSLAGMITKNNDFIPEEFHQLLTRSRNKFVGDLFPRKDAKSEDGKLSTPRKKQSESRKTILMRFKSSVTELVGEICEKENRDVHFIKCIRPNSNLTPELVQREVVDRQLFACGIVDIIRIAGNGYPIRISLAKLNQKFPLIVREICGTTLSSDRLAALFSSKKCSLRFGSSHAFMNEGTWQSMNNLENLISHRATRKIQRAWRNWILERERKCQNQTPLLPVESPNSSSSFYFTPMTSVECSEASFSFYSVGPYGDQSNVSDPQSSFGNGSMCKETSSSHSYTNWLHDDSGDDVTMANLDSSDMDISSDNSTVMPLEYSYHSTFCQNEEKKSRPCLTLFKGDRVFSRAPVHSLPIKLYTKKTALGYIKAPPRLRANGVQDALEEYGISIEPENFQV